MALVIPTGFANLHFLFTLTGDPEPMSFAIGIGVLSEDVPSLQDSCDGAYVAFSGGYGAGNWYDQWTFQGVSLEIAAGTACETMIPLPGTGGTLGTLVQNTSLVVKKLTGLAGRQFRGRCYVPPISLAEVDVTNTGMIDSTVLSTIQTNWTSFIGALASATNVDTISLLHDDQQAIVPDPTEIISFQVEGQVGTQRRRLR